MVAEAIGSWEVWGQPGLYCEFLVSQGYIEAVPQRRNQQTSESGTELLGCKGLSELISLLSLLQRFELHFPLPRQKVAKNQGYVLFCTRDLPASASQCED